VPQARISDEQCGEGLYVVRVGVRPEHINLAMPGHDLICLRVEVEAKDICYAGLPGNDAKLRVKRLKVLD